MHQSTHSYFGGQVYYFIALSSSIVKALGIQVVQQQDGEVMLEYSQSLLRIDSVLVLPIPFMLTNFHY